MGVSFEEFANELRAFDGKREIVNEIRKDLRKPLPELRKAVRTHTLATLPNGNGLAKWVARAGFTVRVKDVGRAAGIRLKLSRKSQDGDKADLDALDKSGRLRHPLHGHRGHWYGQVVPQNFFSRPWFSFRAVWIKTADDALDRALDKIRRG
jgi:hypothetical protein